MFIAAMSIIAILWKELRYPLTDEWVKMWYVYTLEYYSAIRKDEYLPFTSMESIMLSKIRQRKTIIIWFHSYVEYKK